MTEITVPRLGWSMEQGTFLGWLKADGDTVRAGEALFALEGDKSAQDIEATAAGVLRIAPGGPKEGDVVPVGTVLGHLEGAAVERRVAVTPRARRAARERGVDLSRITGTGRGGRVRERDVLALGPSSAAAPRKLGNVRRAIAERLMRSFHGVAPCTLTTTADATNLLNLRRQFKDAGQEPVPSITEFIVKLSALALKAHPALNSRWGDDGVVMLEDVHVGVAVDSEAGLLVPVLRHADRLGLRELCRQARPLFEKARAGTLTAADMEGGTFTVSNLGAFGVDAFTPILNGPQAAILGVGRIEKRPVFSDGQITARDQTTLSLTFDHRIIDGAPAARFLQSVRKGIEAPAALLIA
jgi:pyruvate dehydrogenase E2 component (dihydrolipoamide acetyltransferase)